MKVFVGTSNNSQHLLPGFAYCFNKFWSSEQEVIVLGYDKDDSIKLPSNFKFVSLGKQSDYGKVWTNGMLNYFKDFEDEYFTLLLDDYFITQPVDQNMLKDIESYMEDEKVVKVDLTGWDREFHVRYKDSRIAYISDHNALYRTSLQTSIWKTWFFKEFLIPNWTIWDFEINGTYAAKSRPNRENEIILGLYNTMFCRYWNAMGRGNIDYPNFDKHVGYNSKLYNELKEKDLLPKGFK